MAEIGEYTQNRAIGRPSGYSNEIANLICERLANGESLCAITREDGMPRKAMVFRWLAANKEFSDQYARAREAQADALADEILYIADNTEPGVKTVTKANGDVEVTEFDMTEHRRLRIDSRKWFAGKLAPKKYGNSLNLEHSGNMNVNITAEERRAELQERIRRIEAGEPDEDIEDAEFEDETREPEQAENGEIRA